MKQYVYIIQEVSEKGRGLNVKIGIARNVCRRLQELQVGNSKELIIVAEMGVFNNVQASAFEQTLHRRFKKHHIRGEWFYPQCLKKLMQYHEINT